jgi:hypothetical protein
MDARAVVVGHTPSIAGITTRFDGRVILIDTGMRGGEFYPGGGPAALEIDGDVVTAGLHGRDTLRTGHVLHGPAILLEDTATFWLPPDWSARVLHDGSLLVER